MTARTSPSRGRLSPSTARTLSNRSTCSTGAVLTHSANTATQTHELDLTVTEQVIVDRYEPDRRDGKGYLPGYTTGNTTDRRGDRQERRQLRRLWAALTVWNDRTALRRLRRPRRLGQRRHGQQCCCRPGRWTIAAWCGSRARWSWTGNPGRRPVLGDPFQSGQGGASGGGIYLAWRRCRGKGPIRAEGGDGKPSYQATARRRRRRADRGLRAGCSGFDPSGITAPGGAGGAARPHGRRRHGLSARPG